MIALNLGDLSQSLKFHVGGVNADRDGGIYVRLSKKGWEIASIEERSSSTWKLERLEASEDLGKVNPITIFLDKASTQAFIAFIDSQGKSSNLFSINEKENSLEFSTSTGIYELATTDVEFPAFTEETEPFVEIDPETWTIIKQMADWIRPSTYQKAICGVYVNQDGHIYSTDTSNVFIAKTNKTFSKSFFIPKEFISGKITPSKVVIEASQQSVVITMDNMKFIINHPVEGNLITRNDVFPVGEAEALVESYPSAYETLWTLTTQGVNAICDAFQQFDVSGAIEDKKFSVKIFAKDGKCKCIATAKKYRVETQIETSKIHNQKRVINPEKRAFGVFKPLNMLMPKKNAELTCDVCVTKDGSVLAMHADNVSQTIEKIIIFTNYISPSK